MIRLLDLILSGIAILILSPFLVATMVVLKQTGEGEVFYRQPRVGRDGNVFMLFKFATMLKNSPQIGTGNITVKNDPRILPFGKLLRKTKINELPQLLNVINGDMSLVGPRPLTPDLFANYTAEHRKKITTIRPGLSGIGSIVFRNEDGILANIEDPVSFYKSEILPYKEKLESWYIENRSIWLYLKIVVCTALVVVNEDLIDINRWFGKLPEMPASLKSNF